MARKHNANHNPTGRGQLEAPGLDCSWTLLCGPLPSAGSNLYPFTDKTGSLSTALSEFCESFKEIVDLGVVVGVPKFVADI